nr:hypothetical protein [Bacillus cereus]
MFRFVPNIDLSKVINS